MDPRLRGQAEDGGRWTVDGNWNCCALRQLYQGKEASHRTERKLVGVFVGGIAEGHLTLALTHQQPTGSLGAANECYVRLRPSLDIQ